MPLLAVSLARTVAFFPTEDINPRGKASPLELLNGFGREYQFSVVPEVIARDFDPQKGAEFRLGRLGAINIERVVVFPRAILVDTKSSTDDCDQVLEQSLQWAAQFVGMPSPAHVVRKCYLSQLTFTSSLVLSTLHPVLERLADRISQRASNDFKQSLKYDFISVNVGIDPLTAKFAPGNFTIERLVDVPFSENRYFSSAPIPTSEHISLLEEFESAIRR